ncbi:regulatory LuxR family protein [Mucilaginibacter gracilis]|uniref:Transcriptional regulator, LuxR family n=2 Tax=Mucilaginibacter TaxID=423349 RepID=H1YH18_9SPHI|nr:MULTISPECIES: helix-turn-helix transcriptional regulator [Mucilaginibacter]EHQ27427.1 transcriptional regulator, LuxR family [Mucilaginibacter paludis DSM 18603]RKR80996.1 regulatory LuxR family protein [Mucilaginibacter gracilis]
MNNLSSYAELCSQMLDQTFAAPPQEGALLAQYQQMVKAYVHVENSVAVLSDLKADCSYIYAGNFGLFWGLPSNDFVIDSAFEELIFNKIHPDDLMERHVFELRYFQFQKELPIDERVKYSTISRLRAKDPQGKYVFITHRTIYQKSFSDGSIWLATCIYSPSADQQPHPGIAGKIINNETGDIVSSDIYRDYDKSLLSRRELELLTLVARGLISKTIADNLHISINTVHRHRQNIIRKMKVVNITEAVKTAFLMGIIS